MNFKALFQVKQGLAMTCFGLIAFALSACVSSPDSMPINNVKITPGGPFTNQTYLLSSGDEIAIQFPFFNDMNNTVTIGPDGHVMLPLINDVALAGLTVPQASDKLRTAYADAKLKVKEPESMLVSVKTYALQQIYVEGQVISPGVVRSTTPLTLSRALAQAGGVKIASARLGQVLLVRRAPDGSIVYYQVDLSNGITAPDQDPMLNSYDLIYVPETAIYSVADFIGTNLLRAIPFSFTHNL